jgi:predicted NUDIX family phosphoesterase
LRRKESARAERRVAFRVRRQRGDIWKDERLRGVRRAGYKGGMKEEQILVVRRSLFDQLGAFQGLCFDVERYLPAFLARENNFFTPRGPAETNPELKQIIPYVVLVHDGRVLHYVRGKKAGEQRLVAKGSIGIGGHMNDHDEGLFTFDRAAYDAAVQREIAEELRLGAKYTNRVVALLNDDSNEVGRVHLGVVHVFQLESDDVQKGEAMITELQFLDRAQLLARRDALETWSQFCLDHLDQLLS